MKFRTGDLCVFRVLGKDRVSWLHGQVSTPIKTMATDSHHHSSLNTPKGKTIALIHIIKQENDLLLLVPSALSDVVHQTMEMYILSEDVEIVRTADVVSAIIHAEFKGQSTGDLVINAAYFGIPATIYISQKQPDLKGLFELEEQEFHYLRIKHGYPMPEIEYKNQEILTPELGIPSLIAYDKGCYLGQEVFARIRTYGRTNKVLACMEFPRSESENLLNQEIFIGEHSRGTITSIAEHDGHVLALGFVPTAKKELGAEVICNQVKGKILS